MIVFDLEWNSGYDKVHLDEILQIGAVRLDRLGGRIIDTFHADIRPSVHKKLGKAAEEILDLQVLRQAEWDFPQALAAFFEWCGDEREFATWGGNDMETLRHNCVYWKIAMPAWEKVYNLQASFSALLGTSYSVALHRAVEYCGIPDCLDCHDALGDAVYTAIIGEWLPAGDLLVEALPRRVQRLSRVGFPSQPRQKIGPFFTWEEALNSRDSRRVSCPQCGQKTLIKTWSYRVPQKVYADFCCPEHGWHVCRLTLARQIDGTWRGRQSVPALNHDLVWDFHAATKSEQYACKAAGKKRRRRRKSKRTAAGLIAVSEQRKES